MTDRLNVNQINSDQLDQLYDDRALALQQLAAVAGQRDRLRLRMNALADRWDRALSVDKPYARAVRVAIVDPASQVAGQPAGHVYLSTGCLHNDHAYCKAMTGLNGAKRPGECKKCGARCICPCHTKEPGPAAVDTRWQPDESLDYGILPPPAANPDAPLRTGVALPKEQPMPATAPCTATIEGPHVLDGGPVQCTREAGHPENHVGPEQNGNGRTLWTDHNAGATPHRADTEEQR